MNNSLDTTQERVFVETANAAHDAFTEECFTVDVNQDAFPRLEETATPTMQEKIAAIDFSQLVLKPSSSLPKVFGKPAPLFPGRG